MSPQFQYRLRRNLTREQCPVTLILMLAAGIVFVIESLSRGIAGWIDTWLWFDAGSWLTHPWTLLTGSLRGMDALSLILVLIWLYFVGGSLERSVGSRSYGGLWAASSAITGLSLWVAFLVTHVAAGMWLFVGVDAITVAWAALDPNSVVNLWGILPLRMKWIGLIGVIFTLVTYSRSDGFAVGLFALAGCALAWGYVQWRFYRRRYAGVIHVRKARQMRDRPGPLARFRAWRHARRFEKLMRDSGVDGKDSIGRRH